MLALLGIAKSTNLTVSKLPALPSAYTMSVILKTIGSNVT
jgi:hypothetical protein